MGTGPDLEATGRRHAAGGEPLDGEGNLGRPRERVTAEAHRGRPGMIRLPLDACKEPVDADDARHHAYRDPCLLEHRALLDVQLDIAVQVVRPACPSQRGRLAAC